MKFLNPPLTNIKAEDIFQTCVESYRDNAKVQRLLSCKHAVQIDSANYDNLVPHKINEFTASNLPSNADEKELKLVYQEKMAAKKAPGRPFYDKIMEQATLGICPICGIRTVSTLDHYLPKAKIPTLSVTPSNLIPSCKDCNIDKHTDMAFDPQKTPVHLYYDRIPAGIWLHVNVGSNLEITYYTSCPNDWDENIRARVEQHLDAYHLHKLYSAHAASEIADKLGMWKKLLSINAEPELLTDIRETRMSAEANDPNSWKSALYRGLENEFAKVKAAVFTNIIISI